MTKGSHDSREAKLASSVCLGRLCFVAVKKCSSVETFSKYLCYKRKTMNRDGKENDIQQKEAVLDEINKFAMLTTAEREPASVQMMKIIM